MTILAALKALMLDNNNNLFADTDYEAYLELSGVDPTATYSAAGGEASLHLIRADLLDSIAANPSMFNSYTRGAVSETISKAELIAEADRIRRRFRVVS